MNKGRWILLGFNLVLATTLLVQPGAASTRSDDCVSECVREWAECVQDGGWDCYRRINECLTEKCIPVWRPY